MASCLRGIDGPSRRLIEINVRSRPADDYRASRCGFAETSVEPQQSAVPIALACRFFA
jgi:hypothetical protein